MTDNGPNELRGVELLRHAKSLLEGLESGETVQIYNIHTKKWEDIYNPVLGNHLHLYRIKPKKEVRYLNIYTDGQPGQFYPNRVEADIAVGSPTRRTACVRVEYEPGQFDD